MYSSVDDMVARFGEAEMTRNTTPEGQDMAMVNADRVEQALTDASGTVDSYLRLRYAVPLANPPAEVTRAAAILARYDLAFGSDRSPPEEMRLQRKDVITWLGQIADGKVTLDGVLPQGQASFARTTDRRGMRFGAFGPDECDRSRL